MFRFVLHLTQYAVYCSVITFIVHPYADVDLPCAFQNETLRRVYAYNKLRIQLILQELVTLRSQQLIDDFFDILRAIFVANE